MGGPDHRHHFGHAQFVLATLAHRAHYPCDGFHIGFIPARHQCDDADADRPLGGWLSYRTIYISIVAIYFHQFGQRLLRSQSSSGAFEARQSLRSARRALIISTVRADYFFLESFFPDLG